MTPDLFWIPGPWLGKLALVGRPRGGDWLQDEIQGWSAAGLQVVVSLLETDEAAQLDLVNEASEAAAAGIRFLLFPIPDRNVPESTSAALSLLKDIAAALENGQNVAIHCRQSVGRAGLIAAGVLILSGIDADQSIERVSASRGETVPETTAQLEWIHHLRARQPVLVNSGPSITDRT